MSLTGALLTGRSALSVSQAQLQVTGNNIANAGNADYTRQVASVSTAKDRMIQTGVFMGTGVQLDSIRRQIDDALEGRLRASISDSNSADTTQLWMGRVESVFNELGDQDLSTAMSTFFKSWSSLANKPQDAALRQIVLQNGEILADGFVDLKSSFEGLRSDVADRLKALTNDAQGLSNQIAVLNKQIVISEAGTGGESSGLRDQRDATLKKLSELMDIRSIEQPNGSVNVFVGSEPLIVGNTNRGLAIKQETIDGKHNTSIIFADNNADVAFKGGQIGGLTGVRDTIDATTDRFNDLAKNMIFEVNKLHASGQGTSNLSTVTATNGVDDPALALTDPRTNLKFTPKSGSFVVHVKEKATGLTTSTLVQVDADGLNADDTTLNSLAADLAGITGLNVSTTAGKLAVSAASSAVEFSFSQDTSGTLAALGVNGFFTGSSAFDMGVSSVIKANPALLAAAKNGEPADNQTALAIANLETATLSSLTHGSLKETYQAMVNNVSVLTAASKSDAEAAHVVQDTLFNQREALSGVSMDEEAINLMRQQRAFQGASRLINVVNDLMDTVMGLVR
ncbi:MAG TPA: flagellar hook-associated protein FlgK [Tepidisphaeraceae bacterium]|jgi:flagellar hook-associated protein 1 FlgK|nr:flagellar hook-associated protein FlgK [Tepidisphaeraceae bacterium]